MVTLRVSAQSSKIKVSIPSKDTLSIKSNPKDSTIKKNDSAFINISPDAIKDEIKYKAKDSVVFWVNNKKIYLYGNAQVNYQDIEMKAERITVDYVTNIVTADGVLDSNDVLTGTPDFKEKDQSYKAQSIRYNFKTKKGRITELKTKQGDGNVIVEQGKILKEDSTNIIFAKDAKYTTCDAPEPHYYIQATKMKLIPKDKVISGPAILHIEKVPLPLILPFGFFPASSRRSSGLIFPQYGNDAYLGGYYLRELGYYFGLSDYYDLRLTTDIYSSGGFGFKALTNYAYMYHFNGNLAIGISRLKVGLEDTKERSIQSLYSIVWNHSQDGKSHPGTSFSASVNISSAKNNRINERALTNRLNSNLNSSISFSKKFRNTPFTFNGAMRHSQTSDGHVNMSLPDGGFYMNSMNPFKSKDANPNDPKWYQQIQFSYNNNFTNQVSVADSTLLKSSTYKNPSIFRYGAKQSSGLNTSFKILKYLSLTPSISYNGYLNFNRLDYAYNPLTKKVESQNKRGAYYSNDYSFALNASTMIYGTVNVKNSRLLAVRHVLTPSISYSYTPDFRKFNGYFTQIGVDTPGRSSDYKKYYDRFANGVLGHPSGAGVFSGLTFNLGNVLALKLKNPKDTAHPTRKVNLLEGFNISTRYNFVADTNKLSVINFSGNTRLNAFTNINFGAIFDPYYFKGPDKTRYFEIDKTGKVGSWTSSNITISMSLNPAAEKAKEAKAKKDPRIGYFYPGQYVDESIKLNGSINYTLYHQKIYSQAKKAIIDTITTNSLGLGGALQITKTWRVESTLNFDVRKLNLTASAFNFTKDLHCWEMKFQWIPFGQFTSYYFQIYIKSTMLKDLKYDKRRSFNNY